MNELIEPIISWSALLYGLVALLLIGAVVEYILEQRKISPQDRGNDPAGKRRQLSPSQKTIQRYYKRYYNRNQYENKGA